MSSKWVSKNPDLDKQAANITEWIKSHPLKRNMTFYRALNLPKPVFEKYLKAGVVSGVGGIQSMSTSKEHSKGFLNFTSDKIPVLMVIVAKKGSKAAPPLRVRNGKFIGYPEEQEFNTIPSAKFRIKSIDDSDNYVKLYVTLEA